MGEGLGGYRHEVYVFPPRLGLDYARDEGARERSAWLGGGARTPRPTEAMLRPPRICRTQAKYLRADEDRPYLIRLPLGDLSRSD